MTSVDEYVPAQPEFQVFWESLSPKSRNRRFETAKMREELIIKLENRPHGQSEREAIRQMPGVDRTNLRRWRKNYKHAGFDGLIDMWYTEGQPSMPQEVQELVCRTYQSNPAMTGKEMLRIVREECRCTTSLTSIQRVLQMNNISRERGRKTAGVSPGEVPLVLGGAKFLEAAFEETGYLKGMAAAVVDLVQQSIPAESTQPVDTTCRDEYGRIAPGYNERNRRSPDAKIGPAFESVVDKAKEKDLTRLHIKIASPEVVERKLLAVTTCHLLGNGRWDGLRAHCGGLLEELCGYAYMPSTLDMFCRELKFLGASETLWQTSGREWLRITKEWGTPRQAAVVFADVTNKGIWTDYYCRSSKVSQTGRIMPSLETMCLNTGYGVTTVCLTSSGRAPLCTELSKALNKLEALDPDIEVIRLVIFDAEGNSVALLRGLEEGKPARAWLTRLRPSMIRGKQLYDCSEWQPYRDGDMIRDGYVALNDATVRGNKFRCRVVEIRRRTKGTSTYIIASTLLKCEEWRGEQLANLYFERWPCQERQFRTASQAVRMKQVHGYGKKIVENEVAVAEIAVIKGEMDKREKKLIGWEADVATHKDLLRKDQEELRRVQRRLRDITGKLERSLLKGQQATEDLLAIAGEQKQLISQQQRLHTSTARLEEKVKKLDSQVERCERKQQQQRDRSETLQSRAEIVQHDVELDSLFGVLKWGLVLVLQWVLREYFKNTTMDVVTFLQRVLTLPARQRIMPEVEIVTFAYNDRDPEVMRFLERHCDSINARKLRMRSGRVLRVCVDPAPATIRPPPKWSKSSDHFGAR